jgi:CRP/FNR family nitrogen fixation transcriptional regulator
MLNWQSVDEASAAFDFHVPHAPLVAASASGMPPLRSGHRQFKSNVEIFSQYERVSNVYRVVSGAVRFTQLKRDGRRQIGAFYLPGDLFGLELENRHSFSAESIVNSKIEISKKGAFLEAAMHNQALAFYVWTTTAAQLQRAQNHMSVLGRSTAQERLATFLLDMDSRLQSRGTVQLPMPRRDIADYLGLTIETVSRVFHLFEKRQIISIRGARRVVLRDLDALRNMNDA